MQGLWSFPVESRGPMVAQFKQTCRKIFYYFRKNNRKVSWKSSTVEML